jgi:hypothetical protein
MTILTGHHAAAAAVVERFETTAAPLRYVVYEQKSLDELVAQLHAAKKHVRGIEAQIEAVLVAIEEERR